VTPEEFVNTWRAVKQKESSVSQTHFNELCDLLNVPKPVIEDPTGESYRFERHVKKATGKIGFADVWKKDKFAWEYKGKHKNLDEAYYQLLAYRDDLDNPPLSVVCDIDQIIIHTNFVNAVKVKHIFTLDDLRIESESET
jgi:hypothetical protein